ncbi:neurofilament heavy polypeptide-like [Oxyura jamaicensis]|uniref:neurofilament heavy polypeptide-like n=1 Tax=Oxyura jamaicensis TaxID=8884 RepID=UPI0015A5F461|nr:neurofilament heavy polypeptide-like [Oxyura jamaicensis]
MGGIFGKNKRLCVFPRKVVFCKAKGKKTSGAAHMSHDASTWTGENHFHLARIGRTPESPEPSLAESDIPEGEPAAQTQRDTGDPAAPLHAQHTETPLTASATEAQDGEVPQDPEAKPITEETQHQEPVEQTKQEARSARRSLQETSEAQAVEQPTGGCKASEQLSCEGNKARSPTQTTVEVDVHVCAEVQGVPSKDQSVESEQPHHAEEDAAVACVSEETCEEKIHEEVPVERTAESPAALCNMGASEISLKATETREGITNVQRSAEKQTVEEKACCAAKAPPDLQLEEDAEVVISEYVEENASESEQAGEMAEVGDDGQTSKEIPCCLAETLTALQDKEMIKASNGGEPACCRELLEEHLKSDAATTEQTQGLSAAE